MIQRIVLSAVLAVAGAAAAQEPTGQVVLRGGKVVPVAGAVVKGGQVYVTFADGRMQAYAVGDVDLDASGLTPAPAAATTPQAAQPRSLAAARSAGEPRSRVAITDEDVGHLSGVPQGPAAGAAGGGEAAEEAAPTGGSLLIADLRQSIADNTMTVTGTVFNSGKQPVSNIQLQAVAQGRESSVGSGSTVIPQELKPDQGVGFSVSFPISGEAVDVSVRAAAALANFEFEPVDAPEGADGDRTPGEPAPEPPGGQ